MYENFDINLPVFGDNRNPENLHLINITRLIKPE